MKTLPHPLHPANSAQRQSPDHCAQSLMWPGPWAPLWWHFPWAPLIQPLSELSTLSPWGLCTCCCLCLDSPPRRSLHGSLLPSPQVSGPKHPPVSVPALPPSPPTHSPGPALILVTVCMAGHHIPYLRALMFVVCPCDGQLGCDGRSAVCLVHRCLQVCTLCSVTK